MSKNTEGPWEYLDIGEIVRQDDSDATIAIVNFGSGAGTNDECEANGYLLAAAPDLLKALKDLLAEVDERSQRTGWVGRGGRDAARVAIAKAEDAQPLPSKGDGE